MKKFKKLISVFIAVTMVVCGAALNVSAATYTTLHAQGVGGAMSIGNTQTGSVGFSNMSEYNAYMSSSDNVTWSTDHPEVMRITPNNGSQASKRTCSVTYVSGGVAHLYATINGIKSNPSDIADVYGMGSDGAMHYSNGTFVKSDGSYWYYNTDGSPVQSSAAGTYVPRASSPTKVGSAATTTTKPSTTTGGTTTTTKPSTTTTTKSYVTTSPSTKTGGTTTKSSTATSTKTSSANNSTTSKNSSLASSKTNSSSNVSSNSSTISDLSSSNITSSDTSGKVATTIVSSTPSENGGSASTTVLGIVLIVIGVGGLIALIVLRKKSKKNAIKSDDMDATAELYGTSDKPTESTDLFSNSDKTQK